MMTPNMNRYLKSTPRYASGRGSSARPYHPSATCGWYPLTTSIRLLSAAALSSA